MVNPPEFALVHNVNAPQLNELYFHLYLHHKQHGNDKNQAIILDSKEDNWFGTTFVNDWPLYDELGPHRKVVARAQGLHIQTGMQYRKWHNSFSIVFEDDMFKGSSLQVMGTFVEKDEWAIVGGTGKFPLASGVIYKKLHEHTSDGIVIVELQIRAFYSPMHSGVPCWTIGM